MVSPQKNTPLTHEKLKELFDYSETTGLFVRRVTVNYNAVEGDVAGNKGKGGYYRINVLGRSYYSHHLAWFYIHGEWPAGHIDHINHDKSDNRLCNLRVVPHKINMRNQVFRSTNTSGATAILQHPDTGRWRVKIKVDGKGVHIGYFKTFEEAVEARDAAYSRYGFHKNHGLQAA